MFLPFTETFALSIYLALRLLERENTMIPENTSNLICEIEVLNLT